MWEIRQGDSAHILKTLATASVDALITDPPAGIAFMDREWDDFRRQRNQADVGRDSVHGRMSRSGPEYARGSRDNFISWLSMILSECRRILKPGAYGWVWSIPRTSHWTGMACELAGFEVRDTLDHVFGTGFPKSRALLKPAKEVWWLVKAPGELRELRIDENRIAGAGGTGHWGSGSRPGGFCDVGAENGTPDPCGEKHPGGRWPANFALSHAEECVSSGTRTVRTGTAYEPDGKKMSRSIYGDTGTLGRICTYAGPNGLEVVDNWVCVQGCPIRLLDEQAGVRKSGKMRAGTVRQNTCGYRGAMPDQTLRDTIGDEGSASRFFYVAKPSKRERNHGLPEGVKNDHETVKSIDLMEHLVSLITAPGSLILDPFMGSGSTGVAALRRGCRFMGIEQQEKHVRTARYRLSAEHSLEDEYPGLV